MEFNEKGKGIWDIGLKKNTDPYGSAVYKYAESWADLMEVEIGQGKLLKDIAKDTSHTANNEYGITGFMYGVAVDILAHVWKHGEELRQWHNLKTQIRDEGEQANKDGTTLNPALISVSKSKGD